MVLNIDLAPTFTELAAAKPIDGCHGQSLLPLLKGDSSTWRKSALFEYFLEKQYPNIETWQAIRTERWKFIHYEKLQDMDELYDLQVDPYEMKNLIHDPGSAESLAQLKKELADLQEKAK
jgi:N-acetylglucosamine-6-sulfatase